MKNMFDFFGKKKTKEIKSHFNNLVAIAKSDGNFSVAEKKLLFEIGGRQGLTNDEIKDIIKSDEPIKFKIPKNDADRFDQVFDLVDMARTGSEPTENEIEVCIEIAEKLGFKKQMVGVLVRKLVTGLKAGKTQEQLKLECRNFLTY